MTLNDDFVLGLAEILAENNNGKVDLSQLQKIINLIRFYYVSEEDYPLTQERITK